MALSETKRTRLRRAPEREVRDERALRDILDSNFIAHLSVSDKSGQPYVLPVGYCRDGDRVLFHGSTGSRLFRALAAGAPTCLTVSRLEGMVLARSGFNSSMVYRSAMVLGSCRAVADEDKVEALRLITEHLLPGRWAEIRPPSRKELAATMILELPLDECSVKIAHDDDGPGDEPEDVESPVYGRIWAGVVPLGESFGAPVPDAATAERGIAVPDYITRWQR